MISSTGKVLLAVGLGLACIGLVMILADRPGVWRNLWERFPLGRLPGDIAFRREGVSVHFPWVTCLVISIVVSLVLALFRK
jgi:hypothetical protein